MGVELPVTSCGGPCQVVLDGIGMTWRGQLPGELRKFSMRDLNEDVRRGGPVAGLGRAAADVAGCRTELHPMMPLFGAGSNQEAALMRDIQRLLEESGCGKELDR